MQQSVFAASSFHFPYTDLTFPGKNTGERILFVTRESGAMLRFRLASLMGICVILGSLAYVLLTVFGKILPFIQILHVGIPVTLAMVGVIGGLWVYTTWRKSVFIITTRRLTKIIYTTPFTWYQFSLGLDEIADTGSYASSYFEALFHLGYFVARSAAASVKNFKIINITFAQDLHNYVNKLLYTFKHHKKHIEEFRPFIPHLKGEERAVYLEKFPEYKTEF